MGDKEHYVREDVRGFLDMLQQVGRPGVEELPVDEGLAFGVDQHNADTGTVSEFFHLAVTS